MLLLVGSHAWADPLVLPPSIAVEALSETVPTAFSPVSWDVSLFVPSWSGSAISGIEFQLVAGSLEWVRVSEILVVPRARLLVRATGPVTGQLRSGGFVQPFTGETEIPIALLPGRLSEIEVLVQRDGRAERGRIGVRFEGPPTVLIDSSCSPFNLSSVSDPSWKHGWIYVGCRLVHGQASSHHASTLDAYVYWSGSPETIAVGGIETTPVSDSVWGLRLRPQPGEVELRSRDRALKLRYRIPETLKRLSFGMGIGPYNYVFESAAESAHTVAPLVTLYASYFLTEGMRVVLFDAMALHRSYFTDVGLYLNAEQVRTIDGRFSLNLLLGAHVIGFRSAGKFNLPFSAPQGIEIIYRDAFMRNRNLSAGAFLYPPIQDRSYYNLWLRWGSPSVFAEFNYISWEEPAGGASVRSRSAGLSVGFPLFRFL